jgi:ABC-type glutathione transport system ATPase component
MSVWRFSQAKFWVWSEKADRASTLVLAILRLLGYRGGTVTGEVQFDGRDLLALPERDMRRVRGWLIGFVPQSPATALNPALRIGTQLNEAWTAHANGVASQRRSGFLSLLESVSLPGDALLRRYPGELSVGQAQRSVVSQHSAPTRSHPARRTDRRVRPE